jgi:alpha-N-arabinofuranosidase
LGAELLITVNAGTGTAREAADWVRYVNGKSTRVRYWEIGNELYIADGSPISKLITVDPSTYARRFREFAQAMKAADPRIKVGAIGGENQGPYAFVHYPNWNKIVLQQAGDQMDFFAVHNAYAPANISDRDDLRSVYRAMLAAPVLIARNLATVARQIAEYAPARAAQIPIAVTEWGPFFQVDSKGAYAQHTKTLGSALFAAGVLKTLIESTSTSIANFHVLNDLGFMGWINSVDDSSPPHPDWTPTARYYAFLLFSNHFGPQLLRSDSVSPTFDTGALGAVGAVQGVPYLDVVSSLSADGRELYLVAINKHLDSPIQTAIELKAFVPASSATAWTLNGAGIDANTGTKPLRIPGMVWGKQMEDPRNPRYSKGGPGEISFASSMVSGVKQQFSYLFPPHSVTALVLSRR